MSKIREGQWDCSSCGSKGNLGRLKDCPNCANPRDKAEQFYLTGGEPVVTDHQLLQQARAGKDWLCGSCGSSNCADAGQCPRCGAARSELKKSQLTECYHAPSIEEPMEHFSAYQPKPVMWGRGRSDYRWWVLGVALTLLVIGSLIFAFKTSSRSLTVAGHIWERSIQIEKYQPFIEEAWSVPTGGRVLNSWSEIHHYDKKFDHYEEVEVPYQHKTGTKTVVTGQRDLGNGFFEDIEREEDVYETRYKTERKEVYRDEPVYETKYRYEIYRWAYFRSEEALGADINPRWPTVTLGSNEREGTRREKYQLSLKDGEGVYLHSLSQAEWQAIGKDTVVVGTFNVFGGLRAISGVEAIN